MASNTQYVSKTQLYLKVKKPLLERQRRARINTCLDALKNLIAEFQGDDAILRMDKAEMLESAIVFMRTETAKKVITAPKATALPVESFRHGYMNAVNEVSRVMASTPGMSVTVGRSVMTHLGSEFNRLLKCEVPAKQQPLTVQTSKVLPPMSPASSGYHSDCDESPMASPVDNNKPVWRPW